MATKRKKDPKFNRTLGNKLGRPCLLTPEIQAKICAAISEGNYIETAANFAGINKVTIYDWLKKGAKQGKGKYKDFSNAVGEALAFSEMRDLDRINKAAEKGDWKPAAWKLERRNPKKWGRVEYVEEVKVEKTERLSDEDEEILKQHGL